METVMGMGDRWIYLALFASAFVENIFAPIPADTVIVFGAYLVVRSGGRLSAGVIFLVVTVGSILGFMCWYGVGYYLEKDFFEKKNFRFLSRTRMAKVERWFAKYGPAIILGNRFLAGFRSLISLGAGLSRMNWLKVFLYGLISCSVWNAGLIYAGYLLGENWGVVKTFLKTYSKVVMVAVTLMIVLYFVGKKVLAYRRKVRFE